MTKEKFCPPCALLPIALAGAGASIYSSKKGLYKKQKKIILWSSIIIAFIFLFISIYFLLIKNCNECR
jgi:uncharacterized membrane protein YvbJ